MTKLLFINLYGTILPENREPKARNGFQKFLEKHKEEKIAIYSYAPRDSSIADMESAGIEHSHVKFYGVEDFSKFKTPAKDGSGFEICIAPNFVDWSRIDFRSRESNAVMISNKPSDIYDAYWDGAVSIQVPLYKDSSDTFSFDAVNPLSFTTKATYALQDLARRPRKIVFE